MGTLNLFLQVSTGMAFLGYGFACLAGGAMEAEFNRYGLQPFRRTVGALEILGGSGLLVGLYLSPITYLAAAGLAVLMAMGVAVRWRIGDRWWQMMPAAVLGVLNLYFLIRLL